MRGRPGDHPRSSGWRARKIARGVNYSMPLRGQLLAAVSTNSQYFSIKYSAKNMQDVVRSIEAGDAVAGIVIPPDYAKLLHQKSHPRSWLLLMRRTQRRRARVAPSRRPSAGACPRGWS
jgi:hypothetical protein